MRVSLYDLPIIQSAYRIPFRIVMHYVSLPQAIHPFSVAYQPARFTLCHWGPTWPRLYEDAHARDTAARALFHVSDFSVI